MDQSLVDSGVKRLEREEESGVRWVSFDKIPHAERRGERA